MSEVGDHRFMATVMIDLYGRAAQCQEEARKTMERMLYNEFGKAATLTGIQRTSRDPSDVEDIVLEDNDEDPPRVC